MPRSRRFRKSQNQVKPEWGKNNPDTKAKNKKMTIAIGVIIVAVVAIAAFLALGQSGLFGSPSSTPSPSPSATSSPSSNPSASPITSSSPAATPLTSPTTQYSANGTRILLQTSMGEITLQMRDDKPITTENFIKLVKQGLYDGTLFHRVIAGFMIQGGQNQTVNVPSINDEIGIGNRNTAGTIAMAKTSAPNSATSEFFINVADNGNNIIDQAGTKFDAVYTVFGQVIGGMDVVMKISQTPVTTNIYGENSQPVQSVTLIKATVLN